MPEELKREDTTTEETIRIVNSHLLYLRLLDSMYNPPTPDTGEKE